MSLTNPHRKAFYWIVARLPDMTNTYRTNYITALKAQFIEWLRKNKRQRPRDGFSIVCIFDKRCRSYLGFKMFVCYGHSKIGSVWLFDGEEIEERNDIKIV